MQCISIDTININRPDEYGNEYILVLIDNFSRWVEMYAISDLSAHTAAECILDFVGRFGVPDKIHSDRGTQFVNDIISQMTQLIGTIHTFNILAYSHEENAMVERANKEILRHLRAYIFDKNIVSDWSGNLPMVQRIMNSSIHESIGVSPASILFGGAINLDRNIFLPSDEHTPLQMSTWLSDRYKAQQAIIKKAQSIQSDINKNHINKQSNTLTSYMVDDYVLVQYHNSLLSGKPPSKLMTHLRGPMKVLHVDGPRYKLLDLSTNEEEWQHIKHIHPFYYDKEHTDPSDIAARDNQYLSIDSISQHVGDKQHPSKMKFLVNWSAINNHNIDSTWESWKTLRNTSALHKYLADNRMKSLIPAAFK
jgi:hypothetical protein